LPAIEALVASLRASGGPTLRVLVVTPERVPRRPGIRFLRDEANAFNAAYRSDARAFLVRPDGHIGWRGPDWRHAGLAEFWRSTYGAR